MASLPLPPGFEYEDERSQPRRRTKAALTLPPGFVEEAPPAPTGEVHDGDTFRLSSGANARLSGVDAFELDQTGRGRDGSVMPLGTDARDFLQGRVTPNSAAIDTGTRSYGRPVMMLENEGQDVGPSILREGMGLATPEYLRADPRLPAYMEAERLARLNRQGAFAGQFQSPTDYRRGEPDPWAAAEQSPDGKGAAVFWDEATPFQGLRPDVAKGYIAVASDPKSTADDLLAYAHANGFKIDPADADEFIAARAKPGAEVDPRIDYKQLPQALTDMGDGVVGAAGRGLADPINMLDELGGVVDTLGGTDARENVWESDRRFGDILWNNIDQNRSVLGHDDAFHPYARFGGQVASGFAIPAGAVEGVGLAAARNALRAGAGRAAAEAAAKAAVTRRLAITGAAEGVLAGFGAGEGNPLDRAPNALLGAGLGAAGGTVLGVSAPHVISGARKLKGAVTARTAGRSASAADDAPPLPEGFVFEDEIATPASSSRAAMDNGITDASISAPALMDADLPAIPEGFVLDEPTLGRTHPMSERASPEEMAALARTVNPEDVTPIPANAIESLDEAVRANPGSIRDVTAPNERDALPRLATG